MSWADDEMWSMMIDDIDDNDDIRWCHVFRQVVPCLRADNRESSATNSRQSADRRYQTVSVDRTKRRATW